MRRKVSYSEYRAMINSIKSLRHRMSSLRQQVQEMRHYWKIRCGKRKTLRRGQRVLEARLRTVEGLKKSLEGMHRTRLEIRSTSHISKNGQKLHPLFISQNEMCKLRQILSYKQKRKYSGRKR